LCRELRLRRPDLLPDLLWHIELQPLARNPRAIPELPMTAHDSNAIEVAALDKWYGSFHVLRNIDLTVATGERIVVCGPSGSGKSTLIRCINRLEEHQQGSI